MNEKSATQSSIWSESPHKSGWKVFKKWKPPPRNRVGLQFICFIIVVTLFLSAAQQQFPQNPPNPEP